MIIQEKEQSVFHTIYGQQLMKEPNAGYLELPRPNQKTMFRVRMVKTNDVVS